MPTAKWSYSSTVGVIFGLLHCSVESIFVRRIDCIKQLISQSLFTKIGDRMQPPNIIYKDV